MVEAEQGIAQRLIEHDCPYGSSDCPHTQEIKARVYKNEHMLWVIIVFLASEFGMTFLNLYPAGIL